MSTSQFAVYQLKRKPELRNFLYRTYEELAQEQIPVQARDLPPPSGAGRRALLAHDRLRRQRNRVP